jgi:hypothetical protein
MPYQTSKICKSCSSGFTCNSNAQKYCSVCIPQVRLIRNREYEKTHYKNTRDHKLEYSKKYNESEKGRAAQKLRDAIRAGKIERQSCEVCREPNAEGHHYDYSRPLDVIWLCRTHHAQKHLLEPWQVELRKAGYQGRFLLGELIEACKPKRVVIWEGPEKFNACVLDAEYNWDGEGLISDSFNEVYIGSTPSEVVAKLWLALNGSKID